MISPLQRDRVGVRSATHDTIRRVPRHSVLDSKQWPRNLSGENAKDTLKSGSEDMKDKVYKLAETDFKHLYKKTKSTVKDVSQDVATIAKDLKEVSTPIISDGVNKSGHAAKLKSERIVENSKNKKLLISIWS